MKLRRCRDAALRQRRALVWERSQSHDGKNWQPEQVLPRSRALELKKLVGAKASAMVLGEQDLKDEQVSVKKLYRRGSDGTWYCPKLAPNDFSGELVGDGEGFWFRETLGAEGRIWRFKP